MTTLVKRYNAVPELLNDIFNAQMWADKKHENRQQFAPQINIAENENDYWLEIAMPGYEKNEVSVKVDDNILTISANIEEKENDQVKYTRKEFAQKSFSKTFNLPQQQIEESKIVASYENGVLYVQLPKREEVKPKKMDIKIN